MSTINKIKKDGILYDIEDKFAREELLKRIMQESDPTVPDYVKNISEEDINKWNNSTGGGSTNKIINIDITNYPQDNPLDIETLQVGDLLYSPGGSDRGYVKGINPRTGDYTKGYLMTSLYQPHIFMYLGTAYENSSSKYEVFLAYAAETITGSGSDSPSYMELKIVRLYVSSSISNSYVDCKLYTKAMAANESVTITGSHTYNTLPKSSVVPSDNNHFTNKKYVDDAIVSAITGALGGSY